MTIVDVLPLARRLYGPRASVRLAARYRFDGAIEHIAIAQRSTATGPGVEEVACEVAPTEREALDALAARLAAETTARGPWVDPRQTALFGGR